MAGSVKCVVENATEFDLVTTGAHLDDPPNFRLDSGTFSGIAQPPCPIPAGQTLDFTITSSPSMEGWVCYELQVPKLVVQIMWKDPSAGDNGFKLWVNALDGANREIDPVEVTLTDAGGAALSPDQAKAAAAVVAKYTVRLKPAKDVQASTAMQRPIAATPGGATAVNTPGEPLGDKRKAMLELVDKWFYDETGTSLRKPRVPPGESQDLLALAGWTKTTGEASKKVKDDNETNQTHNPVTTSCGDVLSTMLRLWKSSFVGAFMIRDVDARNHKPGAKDLGYYVEATGSNTPKPGDILVLRNGVGPTSAGSVGHVDILVAIDGDYWTTADGGAGALPDQVAQKTKRHVRYDSKNIPIIDSPTDHKWKQLDGWIDLDKLPRQP